MFLLGGYDASLVVAHLVAATALGLIANQIMQQFVSSDDLNGFPRWRWVLAALTQSVILPCILHGAYTASTQAYGDDLRAWLSASAADMHAKGLYFEHCYVLALFASQSRDMVPSMPPGADFLIKLHHWVVVILSVAVLACPAGFGAFVLGTYLLEVGSCTFNLNVLYPGNKGILCFYQAVMLLSNLSAIALGVYVFYLPALSRGVVVTFFVANVGVCIGRQRHALKEGGCLKSSHKKAE